MDTLPTQVRVALAVQNNARWCDTICRAHGHAGEFMAGIWINRHAAPMFYPNAVTLAADHLVAQRDAIRALIAADLPGAWAVKDSFATLDLTPLGFQLLFTASWLWRSAEPAPIAVSELRWSRIDSVAGLTAWERAWRGVGDHHARVFLPALLADTAIAVLAAEHGGQIVAGAIANRTGQVVGLSNMFVTDQSAQHYQAGCVATAQACFPGLPLVGYEGGADLVALLALGFEELGPLRVWLRQQAA